MKGVGELLDKASNRYTQSRGPGFPGKAWRLIRMGLGVRGRLASMSRKFKSLRTGKGS